MPRTSLRNRRIWQRACRRLYLPVPAINALVLAGCLALLMALQAHEAPSVISVDPEPTPDLRLARAN